MSKSNRLRIRELRALYLLLGECIELGADPIAWRCHFTRQLPTLVGGPVANYYEVKVVGAPFREPFWLAPLFIFDHGWPTASDRRYLEAHLETGRPEDGPHITPDLLQRRWKTQQWSANPDRATWHRSMFFNEFVMPAHLDDGILAHELLEPGRMRWFLVNRALGDRPYSRRECQLMKLLNLELTRLTGVRLARIDEPTVTDLSPRQRDVLVCLMNGDSESQTAKKLRISQHTVHDYVKMLHARFGVHSRGELLSCCRKFWPVLESLAESHDSG